MQRSLLFEMMDLFEKATNQTREKAQREEMQEILENFKDSYS